MVSQKDKLLDRLCSLPKDFTVDEMTALLCHCGYKQNNAGKTSGSRITFISSTDIIKLHKPHPENVFKRYMLEQVIEKLKDGGHIK